MPVLLEVEEEEVATWHCIFKGEETPKKKKNNNSKTKQSPPPPPPPQLIVETLLLHFCLGYVKGVIPSFLQFSFHDSSSTLQVWIMFVICIINAKNYTDCLWVSIVKVLCYASDYASNVEIHNVAMGAVFCFSSAFKQFTIWREKGKSASPLIVYSCVFILIILTSLLQLLLLLSSCEIKA